jgi:protein-disulfide isomerase
MITKDSSNSSKVEYRIPPFIWVVIVVLVFVLGMMFQKQQILDGKGGFLGINLGGNKITPTIAVAGQPTQGSFRAFNFEKDKGTISPLGDKNAKVKMVLFSDFECPYCGALDGHNSQVMDSLKTNIAGWEAAMPNIISEYVDSGKAVIYFRDFPAHQDSQVEHNAARCADEQGKFWEMHDALFTLQDEGGVGTDATAKMKELATNLGLDETKFDSCLSSKKFQKEIDADQAASRELGVQGTPHMFINDKFVSGADGFAAFKKIIDAELSK